MARARQDFSNGNGFYLSKSLPASVDWCIRTFSASPWGILVFKVKKLWKQDKILSLTEDDTWIRVVSYFRDFKVFGEATLDDEKKGNNTNWSVLR